MSVARLAGVAVVVAVVVAATVFTRLKFGAPAQSASRLYLAPRTIMLGDVPAEDAVTAELILNNAEECDAVITDIKTSCACQSVKLLRRGKEEHPLALPATIAPRETLIVRLRAEPHKGERHMYVRIFSGRSFVVGEVRYTGVAMYDVVPDSIRRSGLYAGDVVPISFVVKSKNVASQDFKECRLESTFQDRFVASCELREDGTIVVSGTVAIDKPEEVGRVTLKSVDGEPVAEVPVALDIVPNFRVRPPAVSIGRVKRTGISVVRAVMIDLHPNVADIDRAIELVSMSGSDVCNAHVENQVRTGDLQLCLKVRIVINAALVKRGQVVREVFNVRDKVTGGVIGELACYGWVF